LLARRNKNVFFRTYYSLEQLLGMKSDYIELDPIQSVRNILRNREVAGIRELYTAIADSDVVVVDGDGDLIFRNPAGRTPLFNLALIELAVSMGKQVHYINSIFADCPDSGRNEHFFQHTRRVLAKCTSVVLRDHASIALARSCAPELSIHYAPDSLFLWFDRLEEAGKNLPANGDYIVPFPDEKPANFGQFRFDCPYICLTGSSHAATHQQDAVEAYTALARALRDKFQMRIYLTPSCSGDRFLFEVAKRTSLPVIPTQVAIMTAAAILGNALAFVTGRYHPAILASLCGTPSVFLGADSHKTLSLQELLEYEHPRVFSSRPGSGEHQEILEETERVIRAGSALRGRIKEAAQRRAKEAERVASIIGKTLLPLDELSNGNSDQRH
jgi:polysaccharide pyruvyl transferase WcaK-like protein